MMNALHELIKHDPPEEVVAQVARRREHSAAPEANRFLARGAREALLPNGQIASPVRAELQRFVENLLFAMDGKMPVTIGFTSARTREGTSSIAAAAAVLTARHCSAAPRVFAGNENHRPRASRAPQVLLVDTQRRRPALRHFFGITTEAGLSELLHGNAEPAELLHALPQPGLTLLSAGSGTERALSYFEIEKLREILPELQSQFDFIFLDLPSVLHNAEAVALSKLCDGAVLVVRAHRTRREDMLAAQHTLQQAGVNIRGCVLNRRRFLIPNWLYKHLW